MNKFQRRIKVGAFALTFVLIIFLFGCGNDKYSTPISDIVYEGPRPKVLKVDVSRTNVVIENFKFKLSMSDPNQSLLPKDHWTIEGCRGYFTIDSAATFPEPLPRIDQRTPFPVATTYTTSYPVTLMTKEWLERNALYLKGTQTIIPVTLHLEFFVHRNSDRLRVVIPVEFSFTIGDY
jgi:hypothetical protein